MRRPVLRFVSLAFAAALALQAPGNWAARAQERPPGHAENQREQGADDKAQQPGDARQGQAGPPGQQAQGQQAQGQQAQGQQAQGQQGQRPAPDGRRLPVDSVTKHSLSLPGRSLAFTATVGTVQLFDGEGGPLLAEVVATTFQRDGADPKTRPVTFLFNGGPGAASAYLNVGALGPWRVNMAQPAPSDQPIAEPNAETWLDFTDLVFIDPVGTGYSWTTARGDDARRRFWSVDGDVASLATVVRKWVERNGRQISPKYLVGESYGGFRAPKVARALQTEQGVGINGVVLLSPVLDFGWRFQDRHSPMRWVAELPSMAATLRDGAGTGQSASPPDLADVERYAAGEYMTDLLRGPRDKDALDRMTTAVARFTGLDPALVARLGGRVDANTFLRERGRKEAVIGSAYDATVTGPDPYPQAAVSRPDDPILTGSEAVLTSTMTDLYRRLGWRIDRPYHLLSNEVGGSWMWGGRRTAPQAVDDLREALALDPRMRVLVAHGASDLVTPYFENRLILNQLPAFPPDRLRFVVYGGGHMFYSREGSRKAFRADAEALYGAATE